MWLVILSNQLKIVALVSHYLTNKLILHRLIRWWDPKPSLLRRDYAVLIRVSSSCPPPLGRFLCIPPPSATLITSEDAFSFDLHVWGLPPAFNLSHDQTLQLKFWLNEFWLINWLWWISLFISVTQLIDNSFLMTIIHECPHRLSSYIFKEQTKKFFFIISQWKCIIETN